MIPVYAIVSWYHLSPCFRIVIEIFGIGILTSTFLGGLLGLAIDSIVLRRISSLPETHTNRSLFAVS
jgi:hypothetical protein